MHTIDDGGAGAPSSPGTASRSAAAHARVVLSGFKERHALSSSTYRFRRKGRAVSSIVKFGEDVDGYGIPVLNEREIRAAAGLLFLMMFIAIAAAISTKSFLLLKYAIAIFLPDMLIRVFINPKFSPSLILGRLIVRNQVPEYVGAPQKKYAWMIGVVLALTMFILVNVMNTYSPISGLICLACLVFLFFETAFGICLGCKLYALLHRENAQYCPGEVCEPGALQAIQKTSGAQLLIAIGFVAYVVLVVFLFNESYSVKPHALFGR